MVSMSKIVNKNGRTFDVPAPRETDRKRTLLQTINISIQRLHHGDYRDYIEEEDYEDLAEIDEIFNQLNTKIRIRKSKSDIEWQYEVIDEYIKEHNLPPRVK
jgi:hypothetical protein